MSQTSQQNDQSSSSREVSESAFEFLLAEILSNPAYMPVDTNTNSNNTNNTNIDKIDAPIHRLDILGYDVGYRYAEKIVASQRFVSTEPLDLMKFICKEFWEEVFKKKVFLYFNMMHIYINMHVWL